MPSQACLAEQSSVQQSLQQLQALGEQLRSQVDASSSAALRADQLSLAHHLATLEHALHRQQEALQVRDDRQFYFLVQTAFLLTHRVYHLFVVGLSVV